MESSSLPRELTQVLGKFEKACRQVQMIKQAINDLFIRYNRASAAGQQQFCNSLHFRIKIHQSMQEMFYDYALDLSDEIEALQDECLAYYDEEVYRD